MRLVVVLDYVSRNQRLTVDREELALFDTLSYRCRREVGYLATI